MWNHYMIYHQKTEKISWYISKFFPLFFFQNQVDLSLFSAILISSGLFNKYELWNSAL